MGRLEQYYNKFNEDERLTRRHGIVEYETSMHFIREFLDGLAGGAANDAPGASSPEDISILDLGAATGAYSIPLAERGYRVTALEKVVHNLNKLRKKAAGLDTPCEIKTVHADAVDLGMFEDESFDLVICFGPLYHLIDDGDKVRCLAEAKRVLKPCGRIFAAYCMNEYAVLTYGFREGHLFEARQSGKVSEDFGFMSTDEELYSFVRLEDIDRFNCAAKLKRDFIFSQDGPANYMRDELKSMPSELFNEFLNYHIATCRRPELLGAGYHVVDVLMK